MKKLALLFVSLLLIFGCATTQPTKKPFDPSIQKLIEYKSHRVYFVNDTEDVWDTKVSRLENGNWVLIKEKKLQGYHLISEEKKDFDYMYVMHLPLGMYKVCIRKANLPETEWECHEINLEDVLKANPKLVPVFTISEEE